MAKLADHSVFGPCAFGNKAPRQSGLDWSNLAKPDNLRNCLARVSAVQITGMPAGPKLRRCFGIQRAEGAPLGDKCGECGISTSLDEVEKYKR